MRRASLTAVLAVIASLVPIPASAWGYTAHRLIMRRAIDLLPSEVKPFFVAHRDEIVIRVIDPDLWRNVGWEDDPHHFINFGAKEFGEYPFRGMPRDYDAALEKFGISTLKRLGMVPWRVQEEFGNLRRSFETLGRGVDFAVNDIVLFSAVMSHYIQDASQPLHASNNYDGQLTGNAGVHSRFETQVVERFASRLTIPVKPVTVIARPRDAAFDACLSGYKLVDAILAADNEAKAGKDVYDDGYFEKFFAKVKPVLDQRLGDSAQATAGLI